MLWRMTLARFCTNCGEWFDGAVMVKHCSVPQPVTWQPPAPPMHVYSETLPAEPGYYVYRIWGAVDHCLYVGMVGDKGPRKLSARLAEHRRAKPWWAAVKRIDAADCGDQHEVMAEEAYQISICRPWHNKRRERLPWPDPRWGIF